jgi:hypothetical protein
MEEGLPPGFRFHPTDEELVSYYLTRKVSDLGFAARAIADVDLNKCEPWDLPSKHQETTYIQVYQHHTDLINRSIHRSTPYNNL